MCDTKQKTTTQHTRYRYFESFYKRLVWEENISSEALWDAVSRAESGLIDADLGGGVIKQRIARDGGKSKGFRSIILFRKGERVFFVYAFAKNVRANLRNDEQAQFKAMAQSVLSLSEEMLQQLILKRQFEEVINNG